MTHGKLRCASTNPPIKGPTVVPPTEDKTMNAMAYCWSLASKRSATILRVTGSLMSAFLDRTRIVQETAAQGLLTGPSCRQQTTKTSSYDDTPKIWSQRARKLPNIHKKQTELKDRPSSRFLTPWCPNSDPKA